MRLRRADSCDVRVLVLAGLSGAALFSAWRWGYPRVQRFVYRLRLVHAEGVARELDTQFWDVLFDGFGGDADLITAFEDYTYEIIEEAEDGD